MRHHQCGALRAAAEQAAAARDQHLPPLPDRARSKPCRICKAILALGKIAHDSVCKALGLKLKDHPFKHAARYEAGKLSLVASYHCSRYNTNTRVLTEEMFDAVVKEAKIAAMPAI